MGSTIIRVKTIKLYCVIIAGMLLWSGLCVQTCVPAPHQAPLQRNVALAQPIVLIANHPDGRVRYIAGTNLLSSADNTVSVANHQEAMAVLQKLIVSQPTLFTNISTNFIRIDRIRTSRDFITDIIFYQYTSGLRVEATRSILTLHRRKLKQYFGNLLNDELLMRSPNPLAIENVITRVSSLTHLSFTLQDRYYVHSTNILEAVTRFSVNDTPGGYLDYFESSGRLVHDLAEEHANMVSKTSTAGLYDEAFKLVGTDLKPIKVTQSSFSFNGFGLPFTICVGELDYGSEDANGEPKLVFGSASADTVYSRIVDCASGAIYIDSTDHADHLFALSNVYYWMHQLKLFANSGFAAYNSIYDWDDYESENLKVHVRPHGSKNPFFQHGISEYRIVLYLSDKHGRNNALDLKTMAHEYGHFIGAMYDSIKGSKGNWKYKCLLEGWADHNVLRFALYRNDRGQIALSYDTKGISNRDYAHEYSIINGEYVPTRDGSFGSALFHEPDSPLCEEPDEWANDHTLLYQCGAILSTVYWELAWNTSRVPFYGSRFGGPILGTSSGPEFYLEDLPGDLEGAQQFVNIAYTYALTCMGSNWTIADFFNAVSFRYSLLVEDGLVDPWDQFGIEGVLAHHGVGWLHHVISDLPKLPQSKLPVSYTKHARFDDYLIAADQKQHLIVGEEFETMYSAQILRFEPARDVASYVKFGNSGGMALSDVNFPRAGTYEFRFALKPSSENGNTLSVSVLGSEGGVIDATQYPWNRWGWFLGPRVSVDAGTRTILLEKMDNQRLDMQAVHIRFLPDTDADGVVDEDDNCPKAANPGQGDMDSDGAGDECDQDIDGDRAEVIHGYYIGSDNCPFAYNPDQQDLDGDGLGDACDADLDNDGVPNEFDNCPLVANADQLDTNGNGIGNLCDELAPFPPFLKPFEWGSFEDWVFACYSRTRLPYSGYKMQPNNVHLADQLIGVTSATVEWRDLGEDRERLLSLALQSLSDATPLPIRNEGFWECQQIAVDLGLEQAAAVDTSSDIAKSAKSKLVAWINQIDLGRYPQTNARVNITRSKRIALFDVCSVVLEDVMEEGDLEMVLLPGLRATPELMKPSWPVFSYKLAFAGRIAPGSRMTLRFSTKSANVLPHSDQFVLLRWDGEGYKKLPAAYDYRTGHLVAQTFELGEFVILSSASSQDRR